MAKKRRSINSFSRQERKFSQTFQPREYNFNPISSFSVETARDVSSIGRGWAEGGMETYRRQANNPILNWETVHRLVDDELSSMPHASQNCIASLEERLRNRLRPEMGPVEILSAFNTSTGVVDMRIRSIGSARSIVSTINLSAVMT